MAATISPQKLLVFGSFFFPSVLQLGALEHATVPRQESFPNMPQYQLDLIFEDSAIQMQAQANKDINTEKLGLRVSWDIFYTEKKKAQVGRCVRWS